MAGVGWSLLIWNWSSQHFSFWSSVESGKYPLSALNVALVKGIGHCGEKCDDRPTALSQIYALAFWGKSIMEGRHPNEVYHLLSTFKKCLPFLGKRIRSCFAVMVQVFPHPTLCKQVGDLLSGSFRLKVSLLFITNEKRVEWVWLGLMFHSLQNKCKFILFHLRITADSPLEEGMPFQPVVLQAPLPPGTAAICRTEWLTT